MKHILIILLLIPSIGLSIDFDLSTPQKTFESCIESQNGKASLSFARKYLDSCLTLEGKVYYTGNVIIGLVVIEAFGDAFSDENSPPSKLDNILTKYNDLLDNIEKGTDYMDENKLDNLFLELFSHLIDDIDSFSGNSKDRKLNEVIFTGDLAKGVLADGEEMYFKKTNIGWLIHKGQDIEFEIRLEN